MHELSIRAVPRVCARMCARVCVCTCICVCACTCECAHVRMLLERRTTASASALVSGSPPSNWVTTLTTLHSPNLQLHASLVQCCLQPPCHAGQRCRIVHRGVAPQLNNAQRRQLLQEGQQYVWVVPHFALGGDGEALQGGQR